MLDLKQGGAELSRRVIEYHLPVWSFREYLNLRCGWSLKTATIEDVLKGRVDFPYGPERPLCGKTRDRQCARKHLLLLDKREI